MSIALALQCGADYWVQFTHTDTNGNPVSISNPRMEIRTQANSNSPILYSSETAPNPPTLLLGATAASGGVFAAATYFWKVTAVAPTGETLASNEVSAVLAASDTQALSWTAVTGATGYNVYRTTTGGGEDISPALVAKLGNVLTFTDLGGPVVAGAVPTAAPATLITVTQPVASQALFRIAAANTKDQYMAAQGFFDAYATDPNGYSVLLGSGTFVSTPNVTAL